MPNRPKPIPYILGSRPLKPYPIGQKLFTGQAGGFADHFHPFTSHCIFMCIVGSENMLLSKRSGGKILILQKTYSEINYEATWQSEREEMAYFKCIGKGSALTLEEAIIIAKNVT